MIQILLEGLCVIWGADLSSLTRSLPSAALLLSGCALLLQLTCSLNKLVHVAEPPAGDATVARDHYRPELMTHILVGYYFHLAFANTHQSNGPVSIVSHVAWASLAPRCCCDCAEDIGMTGEEAISTGPEAVLEYTSQLLAVMQAQAEARGGVATLGQSFHVLSVCC